MRLLLTWIAIMIVSALPAWAEARYWLVFRPEKGQIAKRSTEIWEQKNAPEVGENIPLGCIVIPYEPQDKKHNPSDYLRTSTSLIYSPLVEAKPKPSEEDKEADKLNKLMQRAADDNRITDAQYIKLFRISKMHNRAEKVRAYKALRDVLPQAQ